MISKHARFYTTNLKVGLHSRIDDGVILTGDIVIGDYVHIGAYSVLHGGSGIRIGDYCGFAAFTVMHSDSDDFSGRSMTNPCIPEDYRPFIKKGRIVFGRHVISGTRVTYMPGVTIGEGAAIGAHSLVAKDCEPYWVYAGTPAVKLKERSRDFLKLADEFVSSRRAV